MGTTRESGWCFFRARIECGDIAYRWDRIVRIPLPLAYSYGMVEVFLGWDRPPLDAAADWLIEQYGSDFSGVMIALPGARSGRILNEILARRVGVRLRPPMILTAGLASDELLDLGGVPAGRLVRTLAWRRALLDLPDSEIREIVAKPPEQSDLSAWMKLADEVRSLFGEVAAEGLDFEAVSNNEELAGLTGEQRRWKALASAQNRMTELVDEAGFVDPHMGRLQAIEAGRLSAPDGIHEICLVGVTELNSLLRRALEETSLTVRPLIFAPLECQAMFDDLGGLVPSAWSSWCTSLDSEKQWFVVDGPADQAEQTKRVMASWNGKYAAEDISIGLADPKIAPFLKSRLAEEGVRAREASGVATADTGPASLLSAVSRFLGGSSFEDFATLVRHPDFEATLRRMDETAEDEPALEPVSLVDSYHNEHLPLFSNGEWAVDSANKYDRALAANMARLWKVTKALLGELDDGSSLSLSAAIDATRCFLARVYGASDLDPDIESDRVLIACLSQFGKALAELETLPEDLAPEFSTPNGKTDNQAIAETLELLNRMVAGEQIPPAAAVRGEATIELLGWLELALDDAPALIVTGFEQGKVPESIRGDAFLPNRLRSSLGIGDNEKRLARDLYATELLLRSREQIVFISGRRNAQGDPEVPSRIVFHCEPSDVIGRTQKFLNGATVLRVEDESDDVEGYELPKAPVEKPITKMSVTAFSRFLNSPYQFYLESILKLKSNDDRARELEPMSFGIIAHSILQRFGEHPKLRHSLNADAIAEFLSSELKRFTAECFGKSPLPAVRLQMEQLDYRLRRFAVKQAERAALGWRIHAVEWTPSACDLMVDGEPIQLRGKIDRIDFHPLEKKWAIWDYKTGETCKTPIRAHRAQSGEWRDLQLPLYCVLAEEFLNGAAPDEIGYISLGSDPDKIDFMKLVDWSPNRSEKVDFADGVASALSVAADVVRKIRRREFFDADGMKDYDPIFAAIGGLGLVSKETGASTDTATLGESS